MVVVAAVVGIGMGLVCSVFGRIQQRREMIISAYHLSFLPVHQYQYRVQFSFPCGCHYCYYSDDSHGVVIDSFVVVVVGPIPHISAYSLIGDGVGIADEVGIGTVYHQYHYSELQDYCTLTWVTIAIATVMVMVMISMWAPN